MINVSNATKEAWMSDREKNHLVITFPNLNLTYDNESIEPKSLTWTEALSNADSMEFVGCIASSFGASIYDIPDNVKGEYITVTFQAGNTDIIPIFKGYVESVEIESNSLFKKIKAYDALYTAGQVDVASWYARLALPMSLGDIRRSLMAYVGLTEVADTVLPNDDVVIQRTLENPDTIKGLTVIKSICQLNGACGIINRDGEFEYRYVKETMETVHQLAYHESLRYEEYYCNPIQRVQIRDMEEDAGVVTSSYGNKYIVQANMFAYELASDVLYQIANNILEKIEGFTYHPMRSVQNGLPFFEVGDTLECTVSSAGYGVDTFLILSRSISGVQFCRDTYESRGTQNQSEYITDVQAQVNVLKRTANELKNLSTKIVDYILPTEIEESNISDGSNSNVLTFEFYNSAENEKSSFYSMINFEVETTANLQSDSFGDCILTISFILDGQTKEVITQTYGDGNEVIMLNYLLDNLSKGNHLFIVKFALSGGSISSMRAASSYILAASVVEEGNYEEDYESDIDQDFVDYMYEGDQEIVGEYIELDVPTGGTESGSFSGNQFCGDWLASFVMPIEYAKIYVQKAQVSTNFPSISDASLWSGFKTLDSSPVPSQYRNMLIPQALDQQCFANCGKHINMWFASFPYYPTYGDGNFAPALWGIYAGSNVAFRMNSNEPTHGFATFSFANATGDIGYGLEGYWYSHQWNANGQWDASNAGQEPLQSIFVLVYNPNVFLNYLNSLSAAEVRTMMQRLFVLAECNVSKDKR